MRKSLKFYDFCIVKIKKKNAKSYNLIVHKSWNLSNEEKHRILWFLQSEKITKTAESHNFGISELWKLNCTQNLNFLGLFKVKIVSLKHTVHEFLLQNQNYKNCTTLECLSCENYEH